MIAILFENRKRLPWSVAVTMAKREFEAAEHTRGHRPRAVVFNPAEAPEEAVFCGLTVYTDREIRPNRIRVCAEWEGQL